MTYHFDIKSWILKNKKLFIIGFIIKSVLTVSIVGFAQNEKNVSEVIKIKTSAVCGMCKDRIEKGLAFEKGIKDVSLDLDTKIVSVTYKSKKTNPEKIRMAISKLGYDADEIPASVKAYEKLPACCKKGNEKH